MHVSPEAMAVYVSVLWSKDCIKLLLQIKIGFVVKGLYQIISLKKNHCFDAFISKSNGSACVCFVVKGLYQIIS